jgi:50S ribosome-binding GTPase
VTTAAVPEGSRGPAAIDAIDPCVVRLDAAITAATALGVPTDAAARIRDDARERLGFPSDAYVVALVGGTGVGKSSLVNALAGREISPASVRRPTTSRPIAWLSAGRRDELRPLLDWLGVDPDDVREADASDLGSVAILDLPDLDSTALDHRRRVEAVLPRVDSVVWVTDPEKYADAVLHDEFLARWVPRLDRQVVVLNKVDRLDARETEQVRRDLERDLAALAGRGDRARRGVAPGPQQSPQVVAASAIDGRVAVTGGAAARTAGAGMDALREWLAARVAAKVVVRARLTASIRDAARSLAVAAGLETGAPAPVLADAARRRAVEAATAGLLRIVDIRRLEDQAVAATRARARARGAGPLGGLTSAIYRWSGRQARVADPTAFLARWRERGALASAVEPIRAAVAEPLRTASPGTRARLANSFDGPEVERGLTAAVDRAVATHDEPPPSSAVWPLIGLLQTVVSLALVATVIWVVLWVLVKFPVDSVPLPAVGRVPAPLVALLGLLALGYVLARLLGAHAGWIGRRWARRLAGTVRRNVEREVASSVFTALDAIDADRTRLADALAAIDRDCRRG